MGIQILYLEILLFMLLKALQFLVLTHHALVGQMEEQVIIHPNALLWNMAAMAKMVIK